MPIELDDLGLIWWGGPIAFILTRKNIVKIKKISQSMREFFINEYGIFEGDSETQYRYGKQPMSFYNSHGTTIPKKIVKKVNQYYQKGKLLEVRRELELIYPELKNLNFRNIYEVLRFVVEFTDHKAIDIDTEKFLPYYRAYNPISIKRLNEVCQIGRKAIDSLHPSLKPPFPLIVAVVGGILGLAVIQNGPKYMREIQAYFKEFSSPPPVEAAPPPPIEVVNTTISQFILPILDPANLITWFGFVLNSFL